MSAAELEGRLHPLAVLVVVRRYVGASLIPMAALLLSLGTRVLVPLLLALILVGLPLAVLAWWRFTYGITGDRLEVRSGIVSRTTRVVPLARVRGVDLTAPFVHRLLGLVKVEIEAAAGGGEKAELSLAAVSRAEAEALRERLLAGSSADDMDEAALPLHHATPRLLALGGLTSGRYLLAPAAVIGVLFNLADDLPGGLVERATDAAVERAPTDPLGIAAAVALGIALVLLLAVGGSLLVDWDFTLRAEGDRLTAERGLLTRRVVSIDRQRIRGVDVIDTPLRRPFGVALEPHPRAARGRRLVRAVPVPAVAAAAAFALGVWSVGAAAMLLTALAVPLALDRYRQLGHRFDGRRFTVREGSLRRRWTELDPSGIVSFELRRSVTQRRSGLATVVLHLGEGAGSRRALDAGVDQARTMFAELHPRLFAPLLATPPPEA